MKDTPQSQHFVETHSLGGFDDNLDLEIVDHLDRSFFISLFSFGRSARA